jgi:hypothetical protein
VKPFSSASVELPDAEQHRPATWGCKADCADKSRHDRLVKLVGQMLALHGQAAATRTPQEQTALTRQIAAVDTRIDRLVYDLYGLTEDEIRIVEGATL